ncbi:hypothetical protein T12_709 [Trichinella patagoniensis]|uniref:Uncharacterized protein n=1 Tax=Trichinella patagoniensis TaxID=990121 RepID=A0A0V0Z1M5_9BILA|nr:hypothetical protein T12_709 [Trichinella patagoniensis]
MEKSSDILSTAAVFKLNQGDRFSENSLHSEFEAALTAIRLVLSIAEYYDD